MLVNLVLTPARVVEVVEEVVLEILRSKPFPPHQVNFLLFWLEPPGRRGLVDLVLELLVDQVEIP